MSSVFRPGPAAAAIMAVTIFAGSAAIAQECDPDVCANPWSNKLRVFAAVKPARDYCGADRVVWVRAGSRTYLTAASPKFGRGKPGGYACEAKVKRLGGRRSGPR